MQNISTGNIKGPKLTPIETWASEVYKLIWKYGLWFVILMCTVASRLFYEMIYNPDVTIRKLLALMGLSTSVGTLAIIWCASMGYGTWSIIIVAIAGLCAYRLVEYIVSLRGDMVIEWFRKIINNSLPPKKD